MERIYNPHEVLGYNGPFLERGGTSSAAMAAELVRAPELPLSEEQRQEAYRFESTLFNHAIGENNTIEIIIRKQKGEDSIAPFFFAKAFIASEISFPDHLENIPSFDSSRSVYDWLSESIKKGVLTQEEYLGIAKQSGGLYRQAMADALVSDTPIDSSWLNVESLVIDPKGFIQNAQDCLEVRLYLLGERAKYKEGGDRLSGAKRAIIDMYLSKINMTVISNIPLADHLYVQAARIDDATTLDEALSIIPVGFREGLDDQRTRQETFRRLDFLRNGLGVDAAGRSSAVSHSIEEIASLSSESYEAPVYTSEQTKKLKEMTLQPEEIREVLSALLASAGMLSAEPPETWTSERTNRAFDGLFQVVENPDGESFAVNGKSGVYKTSSTPRSLYDVLTIGGIHEPTHINQAEADKQLGETIKLASIRGKRLAMLREGGANAQQRAAERELFGTSKPVALTYARALQSLEQTGGDLWQATRAFYDEKHRILPDLNLQAVAREAADRVLRLVRQGGSNSTAMSYAEGGLFIAELEHSDPAVRTRAGAITSLDLVDQVRLHRYGLLPPTVGGANIEWVTHVKTVFEPYIRYALAT